MLVGDVGVDLSGGDIGVAEESLDTAEVGAVGEEIGGENMADDVRGDFFRYAGFDGIVFDYFLN